MIRLLLRTIAPAILTVVVAAPEGVAQEPTTTAATTGDLLVRYRDGATPHEGARYNPNLDVWVIPAGTASAADDLVSTLGNDPSVELVQPQYRYVQGSEPTDDLYQSIQQVHYRTMNVQAAWGATAGGDPVTVAVIDGGVDIDHPDLDTRIWTNPAEIAGNFIDDDTNGCVDDVTGCSFQTVPPSGAVGDDDGHGTFIAGLIVAEADGAGTVGIADNAAIMPVRALDSFGQGETELLAESILYAARNGADILNLSLVVPPQAGTCPRDDLLEEVLQEAHDVHGTTIVAAAGNFNLPCVAFPASSQYSIAVSAAASSENSDARANFSHWGPEIDVAAPGDQVSSTCPIPTNRHTPWCGGDPYGLGGGTSFSAPMAAGIAALLLGQEPDLTPEQVSDRLTSTARDVPDENHPNWDGAGMLNAGAALGAGSAFIALDMRGRDLSSIDANLVVGDCEAPVWNRADLPTDPDTLKPVMSVHSTLGVGSCADEWPPTAGSPWSLVMDAGPGKANVLNSLAFTSDGLTCATPGPLTIAPNARTVASIDCGDQVHVANDQPAGALTVPINSLPRRYEQDVRYSTGAGDPVPSCAETSSRGVWYRIPPGPGARSVAADTFGSGHDTVLAVYRREGSALAEIACNDDFTAPQSRVVWATAAASEYLVLAAAFASVPAHALRLNIADAHVPANDLRGSPGLLDPLSPYRTVTPAHSATPSADDPVMSCADPYGYSLWYSVTAEQSGQLTVRTTGSNYDTVLAVYEQTGSGLQEVACNDEAGDGTHTSLANWNAKAGREYVVVVGSFRGRPAGVLKIQALP